MCLIMLAARAATTVSLFCLKWCRSTTLSVTLALQLFDEM